MKKLKGAKGNWKILKGNGTHYATINAERRLCEVNVFPVNVPEEELDANLRLMASGKDNYNALHKVREEIRTKLYNGIVEEKNVDYKTLLGGICDYIDKAIKSTNERSLNNTAAHVLGRKKRS